MNAQSDRLQLDNCDTRSATCMLVAMSDAPVERAEIVALLFNVSDIAVTLTTSSGSWEETMARKKLTKAERAERDTRHAMVLANARRTRELAERGQARLGAKGSRG